MSIKCLKPRNMQADRCAFTSLTHFKRSALNFFILLMCAGPAQVLADAYTMRVAETGDTVPDENGRFSNFLEPTISSSNLVVFSASLYDTSGGNADNSGIYRMNIPSGIGPFVVTLEQVAREGANFNADGSNYTLGSLYPLATYVPVNAPLVSNTTGNFSRLALQMPVTTGNPDGNSIIAVESSDSSFDLVAAAGATVPSGNGDFAEFNAFSIGGLSSSGRVTFFSAMNNTADGSDDNTAIFRSQPGDDAIELVRKGDSPGGPVLTHLASIRTNAYGDAIFLGTEGPGASGDSHLFRVTSLAASPFQLVSEGDQAPTDDVEPRHFSQLSEIRINNDGDVGFAATLRDEDGFVVANDSGLYTSNGSSETEIVREGQSTPDATATFMNFASESTGDVPRSPFNAQGQFAFTVDLQLNGAGQSQGVFRASESELVEVARRDDVYEGGTLRNFSDPALNNHGVMAFTAELVLEIISGPEGDYAVTEEVLILTDGEDYVTVAREGQMFNGKELQDIIFNVNPSGAANGLNDSATVAYEAIFADASHAIHVWQAQLGWRSEAGSGIWDDADNWFLGNAPGFSSDVLLDLANPVDVQGPAQDTDIHSLSMGGAGGMVRLILGTGALNTEDGMTIGVNGTLSGSGDLGGNVSNQGLIEVPDAGVLNIDGDLLNNAGVELGSNAQLILSGRLSGSGDIYGIDGQVMVNGGLAPGNSPGLLSVEGSVTLGPASQTILEVAGTEAGDDFDALQVGGTLTLAGVLDLLLINDFTPQAGDELTLMQAASIEGEFDEVHLPNVDGLSFELEKTETSLVLSVQSESGQASSSSGGALSWLWLCALLCARISLRGRR